MVSTSKKAPIKVNIVDFVQSELNKVADPDKAPLMAAYMKTDMPFYGVQKPDREPILKAIKKDFRPQSRHEYEKTILKLWKLPHREEKYLALGYGCEFVSFATIDSMPLFERLIRKGAWWDLVDVVAPHLVGKLYMTCRADIAPIMDEWISDDDFWIRRSAILSQLRHKQATDSKRLFSYCLSQAEEKEFFIRKAIGWALREYSYSDPDAVRKFLLKHRKRLSNLSFREGAKHLVKSGLIILNADEL
ncbi:MAG: DNA alkylation repair protein [Candidatus Melainabacteria bacterium]|nr:DNA alkylation repair protein [Candidatus Melainabacteria bacterium]